MIDCQSVIDVNILEQENIASVIVPIDSIVILIFTLAGIIIFIATSDACLLALQANIITLLNRMILVSQGNDNCLL